jgi:serine/threonine protein kinase
MTTATLLRPGDMLGGFRIDDVIGIGGMAIVYRAEQVSLGRAVALKVLSSKLTNDTVFRERFRREGTHAATLEHPNIVPVYDSGEQDGHLYLAMRLVDGTSLAELLVTRGLTADQAIDLLRPIASALDTAHATGLIHRDVKPQNILVTAKGHPYLADFGVAKGSNTEGLTATGGFVGSVNYASPEQIRGLTLTPASDIYALTAVLYQCLTGAVPYPRETDAGIMHAHLTEPPPTLPALAGADSDFHTVLARGMAKDAGARYGHAGDLINAAALSVGRLPVQMRKAIPAFPATVGDRVAPRSDAQPHSGETELVARDELARLRDAASATFEDRRRAPVQPSPTPVKSSRRWPLYATAGAILVAAAIAVALLTGSSMDGKRTPVLRSGSLTLRAPRSWRPNSTSLGDLSLRAPIRLSSADVQLNAGAMTDHGLVAAVPPAALIASQGKPSQVHLAHLPLGLAKSYLWRAGASGATSVYVIATDSGEFAIACKGDATATVARVSTACAGLAANARVVGASVEFPGADPALAGELSARLAPRARLGDSGELNSSRLASRARQLSLISAADAQAASRLERADSSVRYRSAIGSLTAALRQESADARELASVSARNERPLYESRRARMHSAGVAVGAAVGKLREHGFALAHTGAIAIGPLPPRKRSAAGHSAASASNATAPSVTSHAPAPSQVPTPTPTPHYTAPAPTQRAAPRPHDKPGPQTVISAPS